MTMSCDDADTKPVRRLEVFTGAGHRRDWSDETKSASHIVPWAQCTSDVARLDVHNGLPLTAYWDATFDARLVSFDDEGGPPFTSALGVEVRRAFGEPPPLALTDAHRAQLAGNRQ